MGTSHKVCLIVLSMTHVHGPSHLRTVGYVTCKPVCTHTPGWVMQGRPKKDDSGELTSHKVCLTLLSKTNVHGPSHLITIGYVVVH